MVDSAVRQAQQAGTPQSPGGTESPHHETEVETALIERYRQTGRAGDLEAIVAHSKGLVVALARRFRDRGPELDDLIQVAQVGLLLAIERFDVDRGVPFVGFATPTILGELRRHFRTVWSVRMPRSLQEASQLLGPATNELRHELLRSPTIAEVAKRTGLTTEHVLEAMEAGSAFRAKSLDAPVITEGGSSAVEARDTVERLLPLLSPRSREIVKLRFYEDRNQTEIAEIVGISQMHVSRLLTQALEFFGTVLSTET
jgi:RNA polymerase sigma-B factor